MKRCHNIKVDGMTVFIPGCMGGATHGSSVGCTCVSAARVRHQEEEDDDSLRKKVSKLEQRVKALEDLTRHAPKPLAASQESASE